MYSECIFTHLIIYHILHGRLLLNRLFFSLCHLGLNCETVFQENFDYQIFRINVFCVPWNLHQSMLVLCFCCGEMFVCIPTCGTTRPSDEGADPCFFFFSSTKKCRWRPECAEICVCPASYLFTLDYIPAFRREAPPHNACWHLSVALPLPARCSCSAPCLSDTHGSTSTLKQIHANNQTSFGLLYGLSCGVSS